MAGFQPGGRLCWRHRQPNCRWNAASTASRISGAKRDPVKLALAGRLRRETSLTIRKIAERLHLGSRNSLNDKPYLAAKARERDPKVTQSKVMV
jgi:hypothetical protein